jgi:tRNA (cytidine/uridine-2'-O-)-methyltransferase
MAANRLMACWYDVAARYCKPSPDPLLRLALFEPDIPQNTGTLLRLAACFAVPIDLIGPFGFVLDDRRLKRAALDYAAQATICRHASWAAFLAERSCGSRLVLLTTRGGVKLHRFAFAAGDTLLLGRESAGVPEFVHRMADARVRIPMRAGARSLNVAVAGAIALTEALRQTGGLDALCGAFDHTGQQTDM